MASGQYELRCSNHGHLGLGAGWSPAFETGLYPHAHDEPERGRTSLDGRGFPLEGVSLVPNIIVQDGPGLVDTLSTQENCHGRAAADRLGGSWAGITGAGQ